MTDDPFERATRKLTDAFWRRLRDAGVANPDVLASDLMHVVRGHGWRPVDGLQPPVEPTDGRPTSRRLPEEFLARRAALDTRPPCICGVSVLEHQLDGPRRTGCTATGCSAYNPAPERS